jgi:hypothetical protein
MALHPRCSSHSRRKKLPGPIISPHACPHDPEHGTGSLAKHLRCTAEQAGLSKIVSGIERHPRRGWIVCVPASAFPSLAGGKASSQRHGIQFPRPLRVRVSLHRPIILRDQAKPDSDRHHRQTKYGTQHWHSVTAIRVVLHECEFLAGGLTRRQNSIWGTPVFTGQAPRPREGPPWEPPASCTAREAFPT